MKRYEILDGMRGIAAICVMFGHASAALSKHPIFFSGSIAVDLFFILSGFVISHAYGTRENINFKEFFARRLIRLYPMFLFGLTFGAVVLFFYSRDNLSDYSTFDIFLSFIANALYIPYFNNHGIVTFDDQNSYGVLFPSNDPSWSLCFEIFINLFFFAILRLGLRKIILFSGLSFISMLAVGVVSSLIHGKLGVELEGGWGADNFIDGVPRVAYGFSMGIALNILVTGNFFKRVENALKGRASIPYFLFFAMITIFAFPNIKHVSTTYYLVSITAFCPVLVVFGALCHHQSLHINYVSGFLGWISYPVYCIHFPIIRFVKTIYENGYGITVHPFFVACGSAVFAAALVTKYYDEPVRAMLTRKLGGRFSRSGRAAGSISTYTKTR